MLLGTASDQWAQPDASTDVERTDPLRGGQLVSDDGEQVGSKGHHVDLDLPGRLGGVHVQQYPGSPRGQRDASAGLDRAGLVVRVHDRHRNGVGGDGGGDVAGIHPAG